MMLFGGPYPSGHPGVLRARRPNRTGVNRLRNAITAAMYGEQPDVCGLLSAPRKGRADERRKGSPTKIPHTPFSPPSLAASAATSRSTIPAAAMAPPSDSEPPPHNPPPHPGQGTSAANPQRPQPGVRPTVTAETTAPQGTAAAAAAAAADNDAARRGLASMAQLASAWAQVSSRLAPDTQLAPADCVAAASGLAHSPHPPGAQPHGGPATPARQYSSAWQQQQEQERGSLDAATATAGVRDCQALGLTGAPDAAVALPRDRWTALQPSQQAHQKQQQQQQQQHFEAIMIALKLALASLQSAPPRRDGRSPATRAVQLASTLADLCAAGLPLDSFAMCAGVVSEAAELGALPYDVIRAQLGPSVAALVHDMLRVRQAPRRIELLDDEGAGAVREWCLAFHDVRACVVEVVNCWDELQHIGGLPAFEQQALALEALQIGAPLGHALGLGSLSALMEDTCLRVLFPDSYASTSAWLRGLLDPAEDALFAAQRALLAALEQHPAFGRLSGGLVVKARTKSLFSVMKKLLHLGDMSRGGRSREELYDLLGMRAIVQPPDFLPPDEAEAAAAKACYIVQEVASTLWRPIPGRSKDYIVAPKPNGYQSIHLTLHLGQLDVDEDPGVGAASASVAPTSSSFSWSSYDGGSWASESSLTDLNRTASSSKTTTVTTTTMLPGVVSTATMSTVKVSNIANGAQGGSGGGTAARASSDYSADSEAAAAAGMVDAAVGGPLVLELQIRTAAMDRAAESGDAAHAVYKGGLDARTARQLQAWTQELRSRLSAQRRGRLLLRAASSSSSSSAGSLSDEDAARAAERRRRRRERRAAATAAVTAASATGGTPLPAALAAAVESEAGPHAVAGGAVSESAVLPASPSTGSGRTAAPAQLSPVLVSQPQLAVPHSAASTAPVSTSTSTTASSTIGTSGSSPGPGAAGSASSSGGAAPETAPSSSHAAPHPASGQVRTGALLPRPARHADGHQTTPPGLLRLGQLQRPQLPQGGSITGEAWVTSAGGPAKRAEVGEAATGGVGLPFGALEAASAPELSSSSARAAVEQQPPDTEGGSSVVQSPLTLLLPGPAASQSQSPEQATPQPSAQAPLQQQPGLPQQPDSHLQPSSSSPSSSLQEQQQQQQQQQQLVMLFNSMGSVDDVDDPPLVIGLAPRDAAAAAEQLFRHLDVNGDGRLSLGEVRQVLMDLAAPASERDAEALMAALDRNGDGGVSLQEFVEGVSRAQLQHEGEVREARQREEQEREARQEETRRRRETAQQQQQQMSQWQPWKHRW